MPEAKRSDTIAGFVRHGIQRLFEQLAEEIGVGNVELTEKQALGAPMAIFAASLYLEDAWDNYVKDTEAETHPGVPLLDRER